MLSARHWPAGLVWVAVAGGHALLLLALGLIDLGPRATLPKVEWMQTVEVMPESLQVRSAQPKPIPPAPRAQPAPQPPAPRGPGPTTSVATPTVTSSLPALQPGVGVTDSAAVSAAPGPSASPASSAGRAVADELTLPSQSAAYLNNPPPTYPAISKRLGEQGRVVIRVHIDERGMPKEAQFETRSGYSRLDQAAMDAVMSWRYVPAKRGEVPLAMWFNVPITFDLKQKLD